MSMFRFTHRLIHSNKLYWCAGVLLATSGAAQELISTAGSGGSVHLFNSDAAILEAGEVRKDLPCTVNINKPALGFDLKFHTGYDVTIPLRDLAGWNILLTL